MKPDRLVKEWNDATASYHYVLYMPSVFGLDTSIGRGGKAWALRTAKHYDMEIENDTE